MITQVTGAEDAPPFSRVVPLADVGLSGTTVTLTASPSERQALAEAFDLVDLPSFEATLTVKPWTSHGYRVEGRVIATVVQSCVVTLDPVENSVDEALDVKFVPPSEIAKYEPKHNEEGEIELDAETLDIPDVLDGDGIDVGVLAAEHLALGLDPYPRKPGIAFDPDAFGLASPADEKVSPFAALAQLKKD